MWSITLKRCRELSSTGSLSSYCWCKVFDSTSNFTNNSTRSINDTQKRRFRCRGDPLAIANYVKEHDDWQRFFVVGRAEYDIRKKVARESRKRNDGLADINTGKEQRHCERFELCSRCSILTIPLLTDKLSL